MRATKKHAARLGPCATYCTALYSKTTKPLRFYKQLRSDGIQLLTPCREGTRQDRHRVLWSTPHATSKYLGCSGKHTRHPSFSSHFLPPAILSLSKPHPSARPCLQLLLTPLLSLFAPPVSPPAPPPALRARAALSQHRSERHYYIPTHNPSAAARCRATAPTQTARCLAHLNMGDHTHNVGSKVPFTEPLFRANPDEVSQSLSCPLAAAIRK